MHDWNDTGEAVGHVHSCSEWAVGGGAEVGVDREDRTKSAEGEDHGPICVLEVRVAVEAVVE